MSLACEDEDAFPQLKSYGSEGNAVAVWVDEQENHYSTESFFKASHYDASKGTWSKPSTFFSNPFTPSCWPVVGDNGSNWSILGVDSIGNATVVWASEKIQIASFKSSTNQWTDALSLGKAHDPIVSFDSDSWGNYTIAWSNCGGSTESLFNVVNYDAKTQEWSSPISFTSNAYRPEVGNFRRIAPLTVKCDNDGYVSVMCCDRLYGNLFGVVYDSIQKEWSSTEVISAGFEDMNDLQIASIGPGQFMGIWIEEKDKYRALPTNSLHSSIYDSNGKKWSTPIQIFESNQLLEIESLQLQKDFLEKRYPAGVVTLVLFNPSNCQLIFMCHY